MPKALIASVLLALFWLAGSIGAAVGADWPARVFAPYMYLGAGDSFKLTDCNDACGLKHYTLAFIIARQEGRGQDAKVYQEPSWYGRIPIEQNLYKDQIDAIRKRGGDVIVSFGGEAGKELANVIDDPIQLEAAYQKVIGQYQFTWLDFDIEGDGLAKGKLDSHRRNTALASLQKKNPGLVISYTLPVDPDGLLDSSRDLLADAVKKGVKVRSVDLMVMFFGKRFINKGKSEGQLGVDSANSAYEQLQKIDPAIQIGLCPCLGRNGSKDEVFALDDAKTIQAFADKTPWVCSLHFWSINDDSGRRRRRGPTTNSAQTVEATQPRPWDFANLFKSFTTP
jgi:chitinase